MSNTFNPDFTRLSNYDKTSGTIAVRYGADAPITEMELNEMQLIQNQKRAELISFLFSNGFTSDDISGSIAYENGTLTITNKRVFLDGYTFYIDNASIEVSDGQTAYLNVFEKVITPSDTLKKYGNENGVTIENYLMDDRYNQEISQRIVLAYELSTTQRADAISITIGTVTASDMTFSYPESKAEFVGDTSITLDSKTYLYRNAKQIPFTWTELKAKREAGDFSGLEIGDYKTVTLEGALSGTVITFELVGIDVYYGYSSDYKHTLDFVVRDVVVKHKMNTNSNAGGFVSSNLYTYLNTTIWNCIPEEVRNVISPKKVLLENKAVAISTSWDWKSINLWILSDIELFGYQSWSQVGYGSGNFKQYPFFKSEKNRSKKFNGNPCDYWLIQPSINADKVSYWCRCHQDGGYSNFRNVQDEVCGLVFGIRI